MRAIVFLCFAAFCAADVSELDDNGYNYNRPSGFTGFAPSGDSELGHGHGDHFDHHTGLGGDSGATTGLRPHFAGFDMKQTSEFGSEPGYEAGPSVSKRFFTVSAQDTDDADDDADDDAYSRGGGHKNYDVVFAKAPSQSLKSALNAFSKYAGEQQTAVYVLSKQLGAAEIGNALRASGIKPNKPEVHFIKYKTQEEAAHAQQQVKAQYDRLGGSSHVADDETAPVQSVVGSLGHRRPLDAGYGSNAAHGNLGSHGTFGKHENHGVHGSHGSHGSHGAHESHGFRVPPLPFASKRYLPPKY